MNKLEELIDGNIKSVFKGEVTPNPFALCYKEGADFVLSLDLPVKFAEWKDKNINFRPESDHIKAYFCLKGKTLNLSTIFSSNSELYVYWLNNVYDGK